MKLAEAQFVVATLSGAFPQQRLTPENVKVYVDEIALLSDPVVASEAARQIVREGDRFPTIKDFRFVYRAVNERHASERRALEAPEEEVSSRVPEWVHVWAWCRGTTDPPREPVEERTFPQVGEHYADPKRARMSADEYEALETEWRAAGAPKLQTPDLSRMVGRDLRA